MRTYWRVPAILGLMTIGACGPETCQPGDLACMERRCEAKATQACLDLAHAQWDGAPAAKADEEKSWNSVKKALAIDSTETRALERAACLENQALSCLVIKRMFDRGEGEPKDQRKAIAYAEQACAAGHAESCLEAARFTLLLDEKAALPLYEKACGYQSVEGCNMTANTLFLLKEDAKAEAAHEKACGMGSADSCNSLGDTHRGRMEGANAEQYFLKACELGNRSSCSSLGLLYRYGTRPSDKAPVQVNLQKAREFYQRSCNKGGTGDCTAVKELSGSP